jgi:hypothetical protein
MRMHRYPWNEKNESARCPVRRADTTYSLNAGRLSDLRHHAWFFRKGGHVIETGVARGLGETIAQVEPALENWTSKDWRVYD